MKEKILVIGYEKYTEKMYPHIFDVLNILGELFEMYYFDKDDRGVLSYLAGVKLKNIKLKNIKATLRFFFKYRKQTVNLKSQIKTIINENDFKAIIAIEHSALNIVCENINQKIRKVKVIFWSLDIITNDHIWYLNSVFIRRIIQRNKENAAKINAIIVQGHARGAVLDSVIFSHNTEKFYLPITIKPIKKKYLINENGNKFTIIQIGSIHKDRGSDELLTDFKTSLYNLILLGHIGVDVPLSNARLKVYPIQESREEMLRIINSADIGFICIDHKNLNNHFYSMAAGQLSELLRLGMPVIVYKSIELGEFVENNKIGVYIENISEIYETTKMISDKYEHFSENCKLVFNKYFNINNYINKLFDIIIN